MGFPRLQRSRRRRSALPGAPSPGTFRLQGFAPSCRFSPSGAPRVYFTPLALMAFSPSGASPPKEPRHLVGVRNARVAFSPNGRRQPWQYRPWAPPSRAASIRGEAFYPPSGLSAPREFVRSGVRVYAHRASIPSWASPSRRCSPHPEMGRISPPLLSRVSANHAAGGFPPTAQPADAPEFLSPNAVALPLSRPPDRFEVPRFRPSRLLGTRAALAYCFASSPRWRHRPLQALCEPSRAPTGVRPENRVSGAPGDPYRPTAVQFSRGQKPVNALFLTARPRRMIRQ